MGGGSIMHCEFYLLILKALAQELLRASQAVLLQRLEAQSDRHTHSCYQSIKKAAYSIHGHLFVDCCKPQKTAVSKEHQVAGEHR